MPQSTHSKMSRKQLIQTIFFFNECLFISNYLYIVLETTTNKILTFSNVLFANNFHNAGAHEFLISSAPKNSKKYKNLNNMM